MILKYFSFFLVLQLTVFTKAQPPLSVRYIDSTHYASKLEILNGKYGKNKSIDSKMELPLLVALEHTPGLADTRIILKYKSIGTSLNARPTALSLIFRRKEKRKYVIRINDNSKKSIPLIDDASFNAKVGVLGHELCHLQDYNQRRFGGVLKRLFSYGSKRSKSKYEKEIDSMTIWNGLGWPLYDWEKYVQDSPVATEKYKAFKRDIYYEPKEIEVLIKEYETSNPK